MAFQGMDPDHSDGAPQEVARLIDAPESLRDVGEQVVAQLKTVFDPEIPVDVYELGLIYTVKIDEQGATNIRMTLTSPMCPAAEELPPEVEALRRYGGNSSRPRHRGGGRRGARPWGIVLSVG